MVGFLQPPPVGHWEGDKFKFPRFDNSYRTMPAAFLPSAMDAPGSIPPPAQPAAQAPGFLAYAPGGDGGAGNGFGGPSAPSGQPGAPGAPASGVAPGTQDQNATVADLAAQPAAAPPGIPGLPSFNETVAPQAPAAPTAPADLAVSEVDPQGPSGAGKGRGKGTNSAQAAAAAQAAVAAVDQAIADSKNKSADDTSMTDATAQGMATGVNFNDVDETGGVAQGQSAPGQAMQSGMNDVASANQGMLGAFHGLMSALNDAIGGLGGVGIGGNPAGPAGVAGSEANSPDANGGGNQGGNPGGGAGSPGADASSPDALRRGGPTGGDRDGKLEPVPIIAHEGEFMQPPETVAYYGEPFMEALRTRRIPKDAAMGLLGAALKKPGPKPHHRSFLDI